MVKIGLWKEQNLFLIHVRDYRTGYGNMHISEPKGIALTLQVWRSMFENMHDINDDVEQMAFKCGAEGSSQASNTSYYQ
jgi:hypothetical protein